MISARLVNFADSTKLYIPFLRDGVPVILFGGAGRMACCRALRSVSGWLSAESDGQYLPGAAPRPARQLVSPKKVDCKMLKKQKINTIFVSGQTGPLAARIDKTERPQIIY